MQRSAWFLHARAPSCCMCDIAAVGKLGRMFYKAYLLLPPSVWEYLKSPAGLRNAAFPVNANLLCGSSVFFAGTAGRVQVTLNAGNTPALSASTAKPVCEMDII